MGGLKNRRFIQLFQQDSKKPGYVKVVVRMRIRRPEKKVLYFAKTSLFFLSNSITVASTTYNSATSSAVRRKYYVNEQI